MTSRYSRNGHGKGYENSVLYGIRTRGYSFNYTIQNAIFVAFAMTISAIPACHAGSIHELTLNPFFSRYRHLFFPNSHSRFQCVNNIAARIKRLCAMRTSNNNNHTGLPDFEPPHAMCQSNTFNPPALLCFMNNSLYLFTRHLLIHLIFKIAHLLASRMIAHNPLKNHNTTTTGTAHSIYKCI